MSELVIYLLVRHDLKMSSGKIGAQCGHAVQSLVLQCPKPIMQLYKKAESTKICLKIKNLSEMEEIERWCQENKILHHKVIDAGRTELAPNTETVLGIGPIRREKIKEITKHLRLL